MIRLSDERYWLSATVDPETNELLYTKLELTRKTVLVHGFFGELRERSDIDDAVFLLDTARRLKDACRRRGLEFRYEKREIRNGAEYIF